MRVEFKRGKEKDLPKEGNLGTLFFTWDTGKIFEGNGYGKPLTKYSSVLTGYESIADLEYQNPQIEGKIYVINDGNMYIYNGVNYIHIGGDMGISNSPTDVYEENWSNRNNTTLTKILDVRELFDSKKMRSISASELLIHNPLEKSYIKDNRIDLIIKDKELVILDTKIKPKDTQKYLLGISTNTKIFVKGVFDAQVYVNYYKYE